jgi:hypothetical protein
MNYYLNLYLQLIECKLYVDFSIDELYVIYDALCFTNNIILVLKKKPAGIYKQHRTQIHSKAIPELLGKSERGGPCQISS